MEAAYSRTEVVVWGLGLFCSKLYKVWLLINFGLKRKSEITLFCCTIVSWGNLTLRIVIFVSGEIVFCAPFECISYDSFLEVFLFYWFELLGRGPQNINVFGTEDENPCSIFFKCLLCYVIIFSILPF